MAIVVLVLAACAAPPPTPPAIEEAAAESAAVQEYMGTLPLNITSEQRIADVVDANQPALATLSSTGAHVAWVQSEGALWNREGQLCIYTFDTGATDCVDGPDAYEGYPYDLAWSPDDSMIAFSENPIQLAYESDIWVYDVAAQTFTDLTDDGVTGGYTGLEAGRTPWTTSHVDRRRPDQLLAQRAARMRRPPSASTRLTRPAATPLCCAI
ncbi:MAG: hypothetical protein R2838_13760 [Caldilineaceae bacterium]